MTDMMKRMGMIAGLPVIMLAAAMLAVPAYAETAAAGKKPEPHQLFYNANHNYEVRDYIKAVEGYLAILEQGLESGNLYFNIGNGFLKLGRLGHAILCYERARRMIPGDSDLKANLDYARSLVENPGGEAYSGNIVLKAVTAGFASYGLRAVVFSATLLYLLLILMVGVSIVNPFLARRFRIVTVLVAALFALNLSALAIRYFDERIVRHGIVIPKQVECKYEPIEKSTTYYTLREGADVVVLNTRNGWRRIKRLDGRVGWVKKDAVEEI